MTDLDAIAARHRDSTDHRFCSWCGWHDDSPKCDARQALDELSALRSQREQDRERYRFGWCCDFDFDNGTYRSTPECISRTRNADAVEAHVKAQRDTLAAAVVAAKVAIHWIVSTGWLMDSMNADLHAAVLDADAAIALARSIVEPEAQ